MGKYNVDAERNFPDRHVDVRRSELTSIIEASIEQALTATTGDRAELEAQLDPAALRRMAATTGQVAAGAWLLAKGSEYDDYAEECETLCGCALWEAGRVQSGFDGEMLPAVGNHFVSAYDNAMHAKFGDGVIHATVVEG